jgi:hypothetical protein
MNRLKHKTLLIVAIFFGITSMFSQEKNSNYDSIVYKIYGDLNKDNLPDMVVVRENTKDKRRPNLLEIFFQTKNGTYKNVLTSTKAVMERFPYGDARTETILEELQIKNGILIFRNQLIKGSFTHKFRYQNGEFELIGFTSYTANAGYLDHTDYNLSTGEKIEKHIDYETDKILKLTKTKNKMSVLPKLKDFSPFEFTY